MIALFVIAMWLGTGGWVAGLLFLINGRLLGGVVEDRWAVVVMAIFIWPSVVVSELIDYIFDISGRRALRRR